MTDSSPKRIEDIDTRLLPDGYTVLYNTKTEWAHSVTPIGGLVWELCDGTHSVDQIKERVAELIEEADKDLLTQQVDDLLKEFAKLELVRTESLAVD